jgi:hypothetical protein
MKIEISYKNSLIGSLSAGESLALHLNGSKLTEDLVVRAVGLPQLSAPTISISGDIISITNNNDVSVRYNVFINGENYAGTTVDATSVDLTSFALEAGTYSVYLTALADGYENSEPSNTVEYVVSGDITSLGGTTWVVSNWSASAGYGSFGGLLSAGYMDDCIIVDGNYCNGIYIGEEGTVVDGVPSSKKKANSILLVNSNGYPLSNIYAPTSFTVEFLNLGLSYEKDEKLIEWLKTYGELQ